MERGESKDRRDAGDETVVLPIAERPSLPASGTHTAVEAWEETTQIDQPWTEESSEELPLSRLALPPTTDGEDEADGDDDNELTDYAVVIEPSTPTVLADAGSAPTLLPRRPLPKPLGFRANTGTTPPLRHVVPDAPSISWCTPVETEEEETAPTVELDRRQNKAPFEKRQVTLQGPAPMPPRAPTPQPLPLASYPSLDYRESQIAPARSRPSWLIVTSFTIAGLLVGSLVGVLAALFLTQ
jgi:hypothetical protein